MLTEPQGLPLGVEEEALALPLVGRGHVEVAANDALQVAVLPVQVTALDGPGEHGSAGPGQRVCKEKKKHQQEGWGEGGRHLKPHCLAAATACAPAHSCSATAMTFSKVSNASVQPKTARLVMY